MDNEGRLRPTSTGGVEVPGEMAMGMWRPTGIGRKTAVFLLVLISGLLVLLVGAADMGAADVGPLLVVVAHPDDEALTMSGVIANARASGRRVYVAVVTTLARLRRLGLGDGLLRCRCR